MVNLQAFDKEIDIGKVSERLLSERQRLGLSQSDVADRLNVDYKTVARLEKGTELGVSKLSGLAQLGFDIAYILSGNRYQNKEQPKDIDDDYAFIPLYDIDVSAGGGSFFDSERSKTRLSFTRYSLKQQGLSPEHLACVRCRGDSMLPTIAERDTIMIDLRRKAVDGGIFVFRHEDSLFVKRLIREKGGIRVISDNQIYPEWFIEPEDNYEIIGKKVWQARWDR